MSFTDVDEIKSKNTKRDKGNNKCFRENSYDYTKLSETIPKKIFQQTLQLVVSRLIELSYVCSVFVTVNTTCWITFDTTNTITFHLRYVIGHGEAWST